MPVLEKALMDYTNGVTAFCSAELPKEFDLYTRFIKIKDTTFNVT